MTFAATAFFFGACLGVAHLLVICAISAAVLWMNGESFTINPS